MNASPSAAGSRQMYCRGCGYTLTGLTRNRCPECGREFDPGNPKSFLYRARRSVLRRIVQLVLVLVCLTLPADVYFGYLDWQVHREKNALQFLWGNGAYYVHTCDTTPRWAKIVLHGRAAWLWERTDDVFMDGSRHNVPQLMAALGNLESLKSFALYNSALVTNDDLANLKGLRALQVLDLSNTAVTDAGLTNLKGLTALQTLNLSGTRVTDVGLANLKGLTALNVLILFNTRVTDAGLANLKSLMVLQELNLNGMPVTDAGLVNLKDLTALKTLHLSGTSVTDSGLTNLKGLTALQDLDLGNTHVTDAGLANLNGLTALQELDLGNAHVTDAGLANLNGLTALKHLNLIGTDVTDAGVAILQKSLPKCSIDH